MCPAVSFWVFWFFSNVACGIGGVVQTASVVCSGPRPGWDNPSRSGTTTQATRSLRWFYWAAAASFGWNSYDILVWTRPLKTAPQMLISLLQCSHPPPPEPCKTIMLFGSSAGQPFQGEVEGSSTTPPPPSRRG